MKKGILFSVAFLVIFGFSVALMAGGVAEAAEKKGDSKILAKVGTLVITEADLEKRIAAAPPRAQKSMASAQGRKMLLQRMVDLKVFAMEARALKIDGDETVQALIEEQVDNVLAKEYLRRQDIGQTGVSDEEIKKYYDEHPAEFQKPAKVKARHILVALSEDAGEKEVADAREKAEKIKKELDAGGDFSTLAATYSDDRKTKKKGGDLGYVPREKMPAPLSDAAFGLKVGEVSAPVKTKRGFQIVTVEDRKEAEMMELKTVKARIRSQMETNKRKGALESERERLRKKYTIEIFDTMTGGDTKTQKKGQTKKSQKKS